MANVDASQGAAGDSGDHANGEAKHEKLVEELKAEVLAAWKEAQTYGTMNEGPFLDPSTMFDDVYADPPERLELQRQRMLKIERNGGDA